MKYKLVFSSQREQFVHYQSKSVQVEKQPATFQCLGSWRCNMQTLSSTTLFRDQACLNTCLCWQAPTRKRGFTMTPALLYFIASIKLSVKTHFSQHQIFISTTSFSLITLRKCSLIKKKKKKEAWYDSVFPIMPLPTNCIWWHFWMEYSQQVHVVTDTAKDNTTVNFQEDSTKTVQGCTCVGRLDFSGLIAIFGW